MSQGWWQGSLDIVKGKGDIIQGANENQGGTCWVMYTHE